MFKPPPQSIILVHFELFFMNELMLQEWMQQFGWTGCWCFKASDAMPSNSFLWGRKLHNVIKISHLDGRYRQFPIGQQHGHCYTAPPMASVLPGRALNSPDVLLGPEWWRNFAKNCRSVERMDSCMSLRADKGAGWCEKPVHFNVTIKQVHLKFFWESPERSFKNIPPCLLKQLSASLSFLWTFLKNESKLREWSFQ